MSYKAYPAYKDSGVEWLGDIPELWTKEKVSWKMKMSIGWTPSTENSKYFDGLHNWVTIADLSSKTIRNTKTTITDIAIKERNAIPAPKGSLLFSYKLSVGEVALLEADSYTNEAIIAFHPTDDMNMKFWMYASPVILPHSGRENIYGALLLNQELIKNTRFYSPSYAEQTKIAAFLDRQTALIDEMIEKKSRFIELLKEKRQVLITHAVTKGINPDVKMKGSGVEWLGEVPEHWNIVKAKYLFTIEKRIAGILGHDVLSITQTGIKVKDIESGEGQLSMDYTKYQIVKVGDFAMNHMDLLTGYVDISQFDGVTSPDYRVFRLSAKNCHPQYYLYHMQRGYKEKIFFNYGHGSAQLGRWRLPTDEFKELSFPVPSYEEQQAIAEYINNETTLIDSLISKTEESINLLKEKRSALITAAVTGKIDVREEA
jgi:type I restriction enzyme S subunit